MFSGHIAIDRATDLVRLPAHLATSLEGVSARAIRINGAEVSFSGGVLRRVDNWNVLVPFGSGVLTVESDERRVRYQLNVAQLLLFAGALAAVFATLVLASGHLQDAMTVALFIWFWLAGGNLLIGIPRFRRFLRKTIASAPATE